MKARMRRMLQRLGEDSGLEGADKLASDEEALDSIFERMQDPAVLERLQSLATSESFQKKVQTMTQNPQFMAAAGSYAEEMKEEVMAEAQAAGAAGACPDTSATCATSAHPASCTLRTAAQPTHRKCTRQRLGVGGGDGTVTTRSSGVVGSAAGEWARGGECARCALPGLASSCACMHAGVGGDDLDDLGVDDEELEEEDAADMDDDE